MGGGTCAATVEMVWVTEHLQLFGLQEMMSELADAFIVLPGGFGTMEEMMEITTWYQLGFHNKPIGILNIDGFYDIFLQFLDHMAEQVGMVPFFEVVACSRSELI